MNKVKFLEISINQQLKDFKGEKNKDYIIKIPKRGTKKSAGYDFFAPFDIHLEPGEVKKIPTGIKVQMPSNFYLGLYPRSGHGFKFALRLMNTIGIIDADYIESDNEGHIFIKLRNEGNKELSIKQGEGMAQGIFHKYELVDGDSFDNGDDRNGGMGSTDN